MEKNVRYQALLGGVRPVRNLNMGVLILMGGQNFNVLLVFFLTSTGAGEEVRGQSDKESK